MADASDAFGTPDASGISGASRSRDKVVVVVIENDQELQLLYKIRLERNGFSVFTANDGLEGLKLIERYRPTIILMDLWLPLLNGPQLLVKLRAEDWGSEPRVIVLTNISKDEAPPTLRFLRVDRYVVKTHQTPDQVVGVVQEVLDSQHS